MQEIPLTMDGPDRLEVASVSDVGCVRENNEDSLGVFPGKTPEEGTLLVVADGMGGAAAGEIASRIAVETVRDRYFRDGTDSPAEGLRSAMVNANGEIHRRALRNPKLSGMGTTCTAVLVRGHELWHAHVGDSRAYLADQGSFHQLTRDHSLAAELLLTTGAVHSARARNVLTRCLGVRAAVEVDVSDGPTEMQGESSLVICSDGLSGVLADGEIHQIVSMHRPERACQRLVQLTRERGAPDNVSVTVARRVTG